MVSRPVIATKVMFWGSFGRRAATSGAKVMSKKSAVSWAWLTM
jgi:hypothetical protein